MIELWWLFPISFLSLIIGQWRFGNKRKRKEWVLDLGWIFPNWLRRSTIIKGKRGACERKLVWILPIFLEPIGIHAKKKKQAVANSVWSQFFQSFALKRHVDLRSKSGVLSFIINAISSIYSSTSISILERRSKAEQ